MNGDTFLKLCKDIVVKHQNKDNQAKITEDNVFIVWSCKTLQNNKALLSTDVKGAPYFEITHNGDKCETYVDVYEKKENFVVR